MTCDQPTPTALAAEHFTDPHLFARQREAIFFRTWQYACHTSQIPRVGDYFSFDLLGESLIVVREDPHHLRAFYNVCRHRGHSLVEGAGHCKLLVCPYHGWSYQLNGALHRAGGGRTPPGADRIRLSEVAVEEFLGMVFVNLAAAPPPMDQYYPGVRAALQSQCPALHELVWASEHSAHEHCHWMIAVENYNECYHCKTAHPSFSAGVVDPASYRIARFGAGRCLRHTAAAAHGAAAWYDHGGADYASFYLWPATALQVYPGGVFNSYHWRPLAMDDTEVHRVWYSADGCVDARLQKIINLDRDTTFSEDLRLVRGVQRGVQSRAYRPGPLILDPDGGINSEHSIATLHHWLRADLEAAAGRREGVQ